MAAGRTPRKPPNDGETYEQPTGEPAAVPINKENIDGRRPWWAQRVMHDTDEEPQFVTNDLESPPISSTRALQAFLGASAKRTSPENQPKAPEPIFPLTYTTEDYAKAAPPIDPGKVANLLSETVEAKLRTTPSHPRRPKL